MCSKTIKMENSSSEPDSPNLNQVSDETKQRRRSKAVNERAIYRPPPARGVLQETTITKPNITSSTDETLNSNLTKRPSLPLYVPKGRKSLDSTEDKVSKYECGELKTHIPPSVIKNPPKKSTARICIPVEDESSQTPTWKAETGKDSVQPARRISRTCSNPIAKTSVVDVGELMESSELAELSNQVDEKNSSSWKEPQLESSYEEDSWEKLYNDTGDLLRPDALEELTLAVGSVRVIHAPAESYSFIEADSHDEDLTHVIEVYDFPATLKTEDLFIALTRAGSTPDFSLKWVDDTHALAVYSNPYGAVDALATPNGVVKLRPISQATKESRNCARRLSSSLQPFKPRPATSATLAKRLVSTALGIRNTVSPEQRKMERQMLADAKAKKRLAAQQKEAAWEGTLT